MADTKISGLPASTTPLAGTEELPIVQSGVTRKVSVANLTAGRAISATELTLSTGNLIIGTSGKGIDFSATPGTGTSELLDDYEEGDFTPTIEGTTDVGVGTYSVRAGRYTKIGRLVSYNIQITWSAHTGTGNMILTGLPFTSTGVNAAQFIVPVSLTVTAGAQPTAMIPGSSTSMTLYNQSAGSISLLVLDTAATLNIAGNYITT